MRRFAIIVLLCLFGCASHEALPTAPPTTITGHTVELQLRVTYHETGGIAGIDRTAQYICGVSSEPTDSEAIEISPRAAGRIIRLLNARHFWDTNPAPPPPAMDALFKTLDIQLGDRTHRVDCSEMSDHPEYTENLMQEIKDIVADEP